MNKKITINEKYLIFLYVIFSLYLFNNVIVLAMSKNVINLIPITFNILVLVLLVKRIYYARIILQVLSAFSFLGGFFTMLSVFSYYMAYTHGAVDALNKIKVENVILGIIQMVIGLTILLTAYKYMKTDEEIEKEKLKEKVE